MAAIVVNGFSIAFIITVFDEFFNNFLFPGKNTANFLGNMGFQRSSPTNLDILFSLLKSISMEQNHSAFGQVCQYLGKRGCTLPRLSRPFLCTWYLCPTQVSRMKTTIGNGDTTGLIDTLQSVKHHRLMMEEAFIEAVL
jgi:hypothetical protein